jgi:DNA replication protein DnaC
MKLTEKLTMMVQQTLTQLRTLKLEGMAAGLEEQLTLPSNASLSFEDRLGFLVEREVAHRSSGRLKRLLHKARLKYSQASLEDVDTRASRGLEAHLLASLAHGEWIDRGQTVLVCGPTGVGKTWLACALAQKACRLGKSAYYVRLSRLLEELRVARGDGTHKRRLVALAKLDVLVLDDWGLHALDAYGREDLLEIIDDRAEQRATVIAAQLPAEHWHGWIGDATIADAILDRILHRAHRLMLKGETLRRPPPGDKPAPARSAS